jgi:putative FmdB family regulatory protein
MPTYEYACKSCGNQWEEVQRITEAPSTECPKCHKASAERQISGGTFILKGGGWYADAYSSTSKSSGSSASEPKTESKTTKTESAPAPAATTPSTPAKSD